MERVKTIIRVMVGAVALIMVLAAVYPVGVGPSFPICESTANQYSPAVAHNSSLNKFLVVWADIRGAGYGNDIYARAVNADGSLFGLEFTISTAAMSQSDPAVAYNPSTNQFLAVWHDSRLSPGTSPTVVGIYGRLVNLPSVDSPEFAISTYERCLRPALAYNSSANQFLVVWEDESSDDERLAWLRNSRAHRMNTFGA